MTVLTYMQRRKNSGIYEFRKRLPTALAGAECPAHLRDSLGELINPQTGRFKRELTVSLRTTDQRVAKRLDFEEAARVTNLFERAESMMVLKAQGGMAVPPARPSSIAYPSPAEIEAETIRRVLAKDDEERELGDPRRYMQTPEERARWPALQDPLFGQLGMAPGHLEALGALIDEEAADYRRAYAERRIGIVEPDLRAYHSDHGIPLDTSSPFYRQAGLAMLRGYVTAYDMLKRRQAGDIVPTPEPPAPEMPSKPSAIARPSLDAPSPASVAEDMPQPAGKGPLLSEAFALWKEGSSARGGRKPGRNTVVEAERAVRYFTQWHGDLRLGDVDKAKVRDFRNALSRLPTRLTNKQRLMPLRKLLADIASGEHAPAHAATVNKSMNLLAAIVGAAEKDGITDGIAGFANPFRNMNITLDQRRDTGQRQPFSESQLATLFGDRLFTAGYRPKAAGGEAGYWFPLIALLTGARLNEIAQLRIADIRKDPESGIWFIDIGTEGGRSIKTASSRRQVPLHAELIRLGLLRYREAMLARKGAKETDSLWPDVTSADGVYAATAYTKFFGRYLRKTVGITDKAIVFHSFRHTFKRLCRDAGLSEELHDALTGHSSGASVGRGYGAGFGLKALSDGISRIAAPRCLKALPEWGGPSEGGAAASPGKRHR